MLTLRQRAESTSDVPKFTMACDESREMCGKKCLQTGEKFESNPCRFFVYFLIIEEEGMREKLDKTLTRTLSAIAVLQSCREIGRGWSRSPTRTAWLRLTR